MDEKEDIRKIFRLFEIRAKELYESNFTKKLRGSGVTIKAEIGKYGTIERKGPDYESIKSFVITFRNFILDGDRISIREISKIYERLPENDPIKNEFREVRKIFNEFLDSPSIFQIDEEKITNRKIIDTYIYGDVIHLNKHDEFKKWIDHNPTRELMYNEIVGILGRASQFIYFFNSINQKYLKRMYEN